MSDPLQSYFDKAPAAAPAGDPLAGYFGTSEADESGPDFNSAIGRRDANVQSLQDNIARLQAIKPANAAHKARIDRLISAYQAQLPRGYGFIPGTSDPSASPVKDALAGFFGGIPQGLMGGAALAGAAIAPAGKGPFGGLSRQVAEASQQITEETNPQGGAGAVGELIGNLAGGTLPYGTAAEVGAEQIAKLAPKGVVARAVKAGSKATVGQRVAKNLAGGVPINLTLAVGQPITGDPAQDLAARAKQFGIGTIADILFGMLPAHRGKAERAPSATPEVPPPASPERTQAFLDIQAKRQAREAAAVYDKLSKTQARAEWQVVNQGKKWTDLIPDDRKTLVKAWKERHPPTDTSTPAATPEQQAAIDAGPPKVEPTEVPAVVAQVQQALEEKGATDVKATDVMQTLQESDRRAAPRPSDAVVWTLEERSRFITDRQKAYAAKINKLFSQWTPSEKAGYVADQMAVRRELAANKALGEKPPDTSVPAGESPSGVTEGAPSDVAPQTPSGVSDEIPDDNFDELVNQVQAKGGLKSPTELAAFNQELIAIHEKPLSPDEHAAEIAQLVEDFTPAEPTPATRADVQGAAGQPATRAGSAEGEPSATPTGSRPETTPRPGQAELDHHLNRFNAMTLEAATKGDDPEFMKRMQDTYNALKDQHGMTDEQLAEQQLRAFEESGGIDSALRTEGGKVGAGFDKSLFKKLGANMYKGDITLVAVKEGLQNALDAVRPLLGKRDGEVNLTVIPSKDELHFEDNGIGMLPEVVEKEFVDIGGSAKSSEAGMSGGYGLAKVGLFSQADEIEVITTAMRPNGTKVGTTLTGSGDDWVNGQMHMHVAENVGDPTGTYMKIKLAKPDKGQHEWWRATEQLKHFVNYNKTGIPLHIKVDDGWGDRLKEIPHENVYERDYGQPYSQDIPSAGIDIYPSNKTKNASSINVRVLNNGHYQFSEYQYVGQMAHIPEDIVVDVTPKVDVNDAKYPFTTAREELKSDVRDVVNEFVKNLQGSAQKRKAENLFNAMRDAPRVKDAGAYGVYATDEKIPKDVVQNVADADYSKTLNGALDRITAAILRASRTQYPTMEAPVFGGFGLGSNYLGINIMRKALITFAKEAGADARYGPGQDRNLILFNPFVTALETLRKLGLREGEIPEVDVRRLQEALAHSSIGTMVHEIAHQLSRGHTEEFAGVLTRILSHAGEIHSQLKQDVLMGWDFLSNPMLRETFMDHLSEVQTSWGGENAFKEFAGHNVTDSGSNLGGGDAASSSIPRPARGDEGSAAAGGERAGGLSEGGGSVREEGRQATELPGLAKGDGKDSERQALLKELVRTPIAQRGPILLKIKQLAAATKPEVTVPTEAPVLPEARSTPATTDSNATRSSVTKLESVESSPLEQLAPRKIEAMTDRVLYQLDNAKPGTPEYEMLHRDLEKLMAAEKATEQPGALPDRQVKLDPGAVIRGEMPASVTGADFVTRTPEVAPESLDPKIARKLFQAPLKTMAAGDLDAHIDDMQSRVSIMGRDEGQPYRERLDKALEERAERFHAQQGIKLNLPPAAGGFVAGFVGGYLTSDDDTDRLTNALMWGAVGAASGLAVGRLARRGGATPIASRNVADLPGGAWQEEIHKHVITDYERGKLPASFREKMRQIYSGIVRRSLAAERFIQSVGASRLGAERNAAKLFAMYGRWSGQTESALKYGPAIFDEFGNYKKLDALGADDILAMVDGDVGTLGDLMAARTKVEMGDAIKTPFDTVAAEKMFFSVPEKFHKAADEMRKFSLAMAEVLVDGGLLSRDALTKFKAETMYATLQRVFKMDSGPTVSAESKSSNVVRASTPLKARAGGGDAPIKNPVEATFASVPWYFRNAEQNKIKHGLVEAWEAAGSPTALMRRVSKSEAKISPEQEAKIASLRAEIKGLDSENAHALVAGLDPRSIDPLEGTMRVYRNGNVETYKMPKELALALQTMNPEDIGMLTRVLGAPARLVTKGITYNPFFLAKMALFDGWQATLNSQYGFRFGLDNMRGWIHQVTQSKKYQELLGVGFAHQSFAVSKEAFSTKLESIAANKGSPIEVAIKQIKEMKPIEAYKTLVAPMGDAARVGEALRALDHGASTIEAAYAGKMVTANYGEVGQFAQMRALNHVITFLNPAMQVMDQAFYRMGVHPFRVSEEGRAADMVRYGTKAFASITIPSMLLWAKYHDDAEITQMRQTRNGSRYWWMRSPVTVPGVVDAGEIIKVPKPIFDGHVWGTSMEAALDNMKGQDPQQASAVAQALLRDAAFNILPQVGVIPFSLQANQDLSWGGHIIPLADDQLALEHRGEDKASWISREVSKKIAPMAQDSESQMLRNAVTPAGLDYIIRNVGGMLGQDAVLAVSQAMEAQAKGYVPAKEELPIIKNVVVDYPNTKTRDIEQFYQRLGHVQTVGATMDHLAKEDPEKLARYMQDNQADYMLVGAFAQARQTIANFRRAIVDIKNMDADVSSADKREIIKTYISMMQQTAATAMMQAHEIDGALK